MDRLLRYAAIFFGLISFLDFFLALFAGSAGPWSILSIDVSYTVYLGYRLFVGIVLVAFGLGFGFKRKED